MISWSSFGLTMSLPEEESEHAEDDDEWCWGLGRNTGDGEGESVLRGEEVSRWSSTETSISLLKSCSQVSTSTDNIQMLKKIINKKQKHDLVTSGELPRTIAKKTHLQVDGKWLVTVVLQLAVLPWPPLLYGPVPVLQHRFTDFDDAP